MDIEDHPGPTMEMSEYALLEVNNFSTITDDVFDLLEYAKTNNVTPGFEITTAFFADIQPTLILDFFDCLNSLTASFIEIAFVSVGSEIALGPIVSQTFKDCAIITAPNASLICARAQPAPETLGTKDKLMQTVRRILVKKVQSRPVKQTTIKTVRAVILDEMLEEDIVTRYAEDWTDDNLVRLDSNSSQFYATRHHPFLTESEFLFLMRDEGVIDEEDENRIFRFFGVVCLIAIETMFESGEIDVDSFQNIMSTWINACIGRRSFNDSALIDFDPIPVPECVPEDVEMWMMEQLDAVVVKGMMESVVAPISLVFGTWANFFCDPANIETYAQGLIDNTAHMRPFFTLENAVAAVTHSYLQQVFVSIFLGNFQNSFNVAIDQKKTLCIYEQISDRAMFENFLTPEVVRLVGDKIRPLIAAVTPRAPRGNHTLPCLVPLNTIPETLIPATRRMLRQIPEYNRCTLAAVDDPLVLPYIVQGESFSIPVPSILHSPLSRALRYEATVALIYAAMPSRSDTVVQLPSQWCMFNKEEENQHDYLYCMPKWNRGSQPGPEPYVYTAIINTSEAAMVFTYTYAGRSLPMAGRKRPIEESSAKTIKLEPGQVFIYKREPPSGPGGRVVTWQCRLRECLDEKCPAVVYMLASIAVYRAPLSLVDKAEIATNVEIMRTNGVLKNHIYSGKQGFEGNSNRRRLMHPVLYLQLTNAWKPRTRDAFYINWAFMQRKTIRNAFYQNVVFIEVDDTERLAAPINGGKTYNEKVGYMLSYQKMTFDELVNCPGGLEKVRKEMGNSSVGQTRVDIGEVQKSDDVKMSRIYPNCLPPLRNLKGLLTSPLDLFVIENTTPNWDLRLFGSLIK